MFVIYLLALGAFVAASGQELPEDRRYWGPRRNMSVIHKWRNLDYGFETEEDYQYAIASGLYKTDGFKRPYDVDIYVDDQKEVSIFLSSPRIVANIPYTLSRVSKIQGQFGPLLLPFPNFAAHLERDTPGCDRIISVFRIFIDPCNRLWAIDSGRDFFAPSTQVCPPKILIYDLKTSDLVLKYEFPEGQYIPFQSVQNGIIVDIYDPPPRGQCECGKAYVTDPRGFSFVIFDLERRTSWVIFNDLFKVNEAFRPATIAGVTFDFPDGIYTSTPWREKDVLFMHSFTSLSEIAVRLSAINNQSLWIDNPSGNRDLFKEIGTRPTQTPTQARDSKGNIYFSLLDSQSIVSWNPRTPYDRSYFKELVRNTDNIEFTAGVKVRRNRRNVETLIVLNIPLQELNVGTISLDNDNYWLMSCEIPTLQAGRGRCGGL